MASDHDPVAVEVRNVVNELLERYRGKERLVLMIALDLGTAAREKLARVAEQAAGAPKGGF